MTAVDDAVAAKDHVLAEISHKQHTEGVHDAGMAVLARYAATGQPFSSNTVRAELAAVGVTHSASLFRSACRRGLLRACGWTASDKDGTNAAVVKQYVGARVTVAPETVAVPVVRDQGGRFTTHDDYGTEPLFDLTEGART